MWGTKREKERVREKGPRVKVHQNIAYVYELVLNSHPC